MTGSNKVTENIEQNDLTLYKRKEDCCGCGACYSVCPKNAIFMAEDEEGFEYPTIDINKCINCSLCLKVCPIRKAKREYEI